MKTFLVVLTCPSSRCTNVFLQRTEVCLTIQHLVAVIKTTVGDANSAVHLSVPTKSRRGEDHPQLRCIQKF